MKWDWADLPYYLIMLFAVVSGQIARLGHGYEQTGSAPSFGKVAIELSMLPAFGALGGTFAAQHEWPLYLIILVGVVSGWLGFAVFKMIGEAAMLWFRNKWGGGNGK